MPSIGAVERNGAPERTAPSARKSGSGGAAKNLRATLGGCDAERRPYARIEVRLGAPRSRPVGWGVQRMNVCGSACLLSMLVSVGFAMEAGAMEPGQPSAPPAAQPQGFALPSFLDVTRLPDLQAAWREHFGIAEKPAFAAPMGVGARDIAAETEETSVRARAEALSRRFSVGSDDAEGAQTANIADDATAATPVGLDSEPDASDNDRAADGDRAAPTETASIHVNNAADVAGTDQASPRAKSADGVGKRSAAQKISASPPARAGGAGNVPVFDNTKSVHASRLPTSARRIEQQPAGSPTLLMTIGGLFVGNSGAPEPEGATMLPTELRSFGWSSQP